MQGYSELLEYLYGLRRFGMKPGLESISKIMESLGNPHLRIKAIHVTGTNGKGSVCAMLDSILRENGYKVGLYTSPHLVDFRERIQVDRTMIKEEDVLRLSEKIMEKIEETATPLTFFEFTTAMMFLYFAEQGLDYAVIEVGMGGRLDGTNIIEKPVATVITNISLEHTQFLGRTVEEIAGEKAGIIKRDSPVFTASDIPVIRERAKELGSEFILVTGKDKTNMLGSFQETNAGAAAAVAKYLKIPESRIKKGLINVKWPGRLEFIEKNVLLDCAHNPAGIREMTQFVKTLKKDRLIIVFAVMADKDYRTMYHYMIENLPEFDTLVATKPQISRALEPKEIKDVVGERCVVIPSVADAIKYAKDIAKDSDLILICGSCYLAGEVLAIRSKIPIMPLMFVQ